MCILRRQKCAFMEGRNAFCKCAFTEGRNVYLWKRACPRDLAGGALNLNREAGLKFENEFSKHICLMDICLKRKHAW